ncbi:MAG: hypothetical protein ABI869_01885 [Actinomycetota bacterium]
MGAAEPEREMVRKALPLSVPAVVLALVAAGLLGGRFSAASAVIGVAVVFVNFAVHGLSLAYAARISLTLLFAVAIGGFVVRLGVIFLIMFLLNQLDWFSPVAFAAAAIPCTIVLLVFEMKQLAGRTQVELWALPAAGGRVAP